VILLFAAPPDQIVDVIFVFLSRLFAAIGWPALAVLVWKGRGFINAIEKRAVATETAIAENVAVLKAFKADFEQHCASDVEHFGALRNGLGRVETTVQLNDTLVRLTESVQRTTDNTLRVLENHVTQATAFIAASQEATRATTEMAQSVKVLVEAVHKTMEENIEKFELLRQIASAQSALAANQANITTGFQKVVEQLIEVVQQQQQHPK